MTRLEIIQAVTPRFSYEAYQATCEANGFTPQLRGTWAQLMGMVSAAEAMYPDLPIDDSYAQFMALSSEEHLAHNEAQLKAVQANLKPGEPKPCGSCGGGKVR